MTSPLAWASPGWLDCGKLPGVTHLACDTLCLGCCHPVLLCDGRFMHCASPDMHSHARPGPGLVAA